MLFLVLLAWFSVPKLGIATKHFCNNPCFQKCEKFVFFCLSVLPFSSVFLRKHYLYSVSENQTSHFWKLGSGPRWILGSGPMLGPQVGHLGPEPNFCFVNFFVVFGKHQYIHTYIYGHWPKICLQNCPPNPFPPLRFEQKKAKKKGAKKWRLFSPFWVTHPFLQLRNDHFPPVFLCRFRLFRLGMLFSPCFKHIF